MAASPAASPGQARVRLLLQFVLVLLLGVYALAGAVFAYSRFPALWPEYRQGRAVVEQVERYRRMQHRLPPQALMRNPASPVYYRLTGPDSYEVSFGTGVGSSYVYRSRVRAWFEVD